MASVRVLTVAFAILAGACAAPPRPAPPPSLAMPPLLDPDSACLKDLSDLGLAFEPIGGGEGAASPACQIPNPVKIAGDREMAWNRPGVLSCAMARTVSRFKAEILQPAAMAQFGQPVVRMIQMGTYQCRMRRTDQTVAAAAAGRPVRGGRLSEHGRGQAIDIGGFELADGTMISVRRDWRAGGPASAFLQAVARGSCAYFNVVLTPNYNAVHADHLHLDIGPHKLCGM